MGELTCRGPYTLRGYYGVPEYNAKQFTPDGFYCSGDLMRRHPSGNYVVEGRKKDLINRGGEKISAEEIENLILSHPAVQNVACVPVPDPNLGEKMCACVVLKPGPALSLDELVSFLKGKEIAKFKLPERLEGVRTTSRSRRSARCRRRRWPTRSEKTSRQPMTAASSSSCLTWRAAAATSARASRRATWRITSASGSRW